MHEIRGIRGLGEESLLVRHLKTISARARARAAPHTHTISKTIRPTILAKDTLDTSQTHYVI